MQAVGSDDNRVKWRFFDATPGRDYSPKTHLETETGEQLNNPDSPHMSVTQKQHLADHERTHTSGETSYNSDLSHESVTQTQHLINHNSGGRQYTCDLCHESFSHNIHLVNHKRNHNREKPYNCDLCQKSFSRKLYLANHKKIHTFRTGAKKSNFNLPHKSFTRKQHFKNHKSSHSGKKQYNCNLCHESFSLLRHLRDHKRKHAAAKLYKCEICQKSFSHKLQLVNHKSMHSGEKPYSCDLCHRSFIQKCYLGNHRKCHFREKTSKSSLHQKTSAQGEDLKIRTGTELTNRLDVCCLSKHETGSEDCRKGHATTQTGGKVRNCRLLENVTPQLKKEYNESTAHKEFRRSSDKKELLITETVQGFSSSQNKNQHPEKQVSEAHVANISSLDQNIFRPYGCGNCDATFAVSEEFLEHCASVHLTVRPYGCGTCDATFAINEEFLEHCDYHFREKPPKDSFQELFEMYLLRFSY